jgi:hypothetical protein
VNDAEEGVEDEIRPAREVARRSLALFAVVGTALGVPRVSCISRDHWNARDAQLHERSMPPGIDIEIVQERHHAINWITGYDGLPWDEVTTDT